MRVSARWQTALFAVLTLACGLAYRATFLNQGFNGADEAWLPALALRVVRGQVPYRDFYYTLPPVTLYKEAALAAVTGSNYTFLLSRWVFAVEVSLGSVIAFLIVRRFVSPSVAFFVTLPTVFFTTVLYYYSNFNFDAQILFLLAVLVLTWEGERERWYMVLLAGAFCGLAFLAKPTYVGMLVGLGGLGVLRPLTAGPRRWPLLFAGFVCAVGPVFAVIWAAGIWSQFRYESFGLLLQARHIPFRFIVYQDWPHWLIDPGHAALAPLGCLAAFALARINRWVAGAALLLLTALLGAFVLPALDSNTLGIPTDSQMNLLVAALAVILVINLVAAAVTVAARVPGIARMGWAAEVRGQMLPPALPIVAAALEYLQGIDLSSMRFAYVGTFLGIPVALVFLYQGWRLWGRPALMPVLAPALVGLFVALAGAVVTYGSPYLDGPRSQMTAGFTSGRLAGIVTTPGNVLHVNSLVGAIESNSKPGETVFVLPDGQLYYVLTGRTNPTKLDWYDVLAVTPAMADEACRTLLDHPPDLVLVQRFHEWDIARQSPIDYASEPGLQPVFGAATHSMLTLGRVDDVDVYRRSLSPSTPTASPCMLPTARG